MFLSKRGGDSSWDDVALLRTWGSWSTAADLARPTLTGVDAHVVLRKVRLSAQDLTVP